MAPVRYMSGGGGVLQEKTSYLIPLSSLTGNVNETSAASPVQNMDTVPPMEPVVPTAKIPRRKNQTGKGVQQSYGSYLVPLSSVNQLASNMKLQGGNTAEDQESYLVLSVSKGKPAGTGQAVKRKGRPPSNNGPTANKRRQVGKGVVQEYESRSIPLKSKGRPTLSKNKKPGNTNGQRLMKQQSSSSSSSDSEVTWAKYPTDKERRLNTTK